MVSNLIIKGLIVVSISVLFLMTILVVSIYGETSSTDQLETGNPAGKMEVANSTGQIDFQTIKIGGSSGQTETAYYVIRDADEWALVWNQHQLGHLPPEIDFSKTVIIAVFMGEFGSSGYSLEIKEIQDIGRSVVVKVEWWWWSSVLPVMTQPYHIVRIDRIDKGVTFDTVYRTERVDVMLESYGVDIHDVPELVTELLTEIMDEFRKGYFLYVPLRPSAEALLVQIDDAISSGRSVDWDIAAVLGLQSVLKILTQASAEEAQYWRQNASDWISTVNQRIGQLANCESEDAESLLRRAQTKLMDAQLSFDEGSIEDYRIAYHAALQASSLVDQASAKEQEYQEEKQLQLLLIGAGISSIVAVVTILLRRRKTISQLPSSLPKDE